MSELEEIIESLADYLPFPKAYVVTLLNRYKEDIKKWLKKNKNLLSQYLKTL